LKRCECNNVNDLEPLPALPSVTVCKSCRGWFAIAVLDKSQLERLREEMDKYGGHA
jgi:hypothetical protein